MILQTLNVVSGVALGAPKLKEWIGGEHVEKAEKLIMKYREPLGLAMLVLGITGLLIRLGVLSLFFAPLGASYPQTIPAIIMGILLYGDKLNRFPFMRSIIETLKPHEALIGIAGIAIGLGSILFGCVLC
jgi:hypothetical protein